MGLVSRGAAPAAALVACSVVVACGSSVVDADSAEATRDTAAPPSPFCAAAQANSDAIRPLNALARGGGAPPEELSNTVDAVHRTGADLLNAAPGEIRADVERTVQTVNLQLDALLANGGDAAAVARDPQLVARLSSPELVGASERYRAYANRNCGTGNAAVR